MKKFSKGKFLFIIALLWALVSCTGCMTKESTPLMLTDQDKCFEDKKNCVTAEKKQESDAKNRKRIGLITKALVTNPFFIDVDKGAKSAAEELNYDLVIKTGAKETSSDQQVSTMEEMISDKVDAIIISPVSSTDVLPVIKKAQEARIPVIIINNQIDLDIAKRMGIKPIPYIGVDNKASGYEIGQILSRKIDSPGKILLLEGLKDTKNSPQRIEGVSAALKENPNVSDIIRVSADWKMDKAYIETKMILSSNPDIKAIFACNDMMAYGAIKYIQESKRSDVFIVGYDNLKESHSLIRENVLLATVDHNAYKQGYLSIYLANKILKQEQFPLETTVESKIIYKGNLLDE